MKLKPCPFCGESAKQRQVPGSYGPYGLTEIWCTGCGATCLDKERWNRREGQKYKQQIIHRTDDENDPEES